MTPQELKNSILQLAIQGKLVEQRPEEGTASTLKKELLQKKAELLASSKILKKSKTKPFWDIDDLFDIPASWEWVQLADVSIIQEGAGIRKWQYRDTGTQILCVTNILEGSIDLEKKQLFISTEEYQEKYTHLTLNKGDIVTSCSGGSWGKIAFFNCDETMMLNTSTLRMRFFGDLADNNYLYYVCKSSFFKRQLVLQLSGMQPNFGYAHYSRIMLPLPPLAEQKRIVAKIEELLPYIDRYEKAWSRLEDLNKRFPADMQKSILQMAIQGKLVEQRPEEGTAEELYKQIQAEKKELIKAGKIKKEKPLAEIKEDEIPFDIPESWKWVRLGNVCWFQGGYAYKSTSYVHDSRNQIIRLGNVKQNQLLLDTKPTYIPDSIAEVTEAYLIKKNDILVTMTGTRRKKDYLFVTRINDADLAERKLYINQRVGCFRVIDHRIESEYLQRVLQSEAIRDIIFERETGTANQGNLGSEDMKMYIYVPLPPLAEQKRIVAKLEEILPMCDKLK